MPISVRLLLRSVPQLHFAYDESVERGVRLARLIDQAKEHDRTGDVVLRNQIVFRLQNDDYGLPTAYIRAALKNAGLI
jgi:hypothetical protein